MDLVLRDLRSWPGAKVWVLCLGTTAALLGIAWLVLPDFTDLTNRPTSKEMIKIASVAFLFPALVEELLFRGLLNWKQTSATIAFSTFLFVLWHPFAGRFLIPEAFPYVSDIRFLAFTAIFGLSFCLMRRQTKSLWPPIICHWLVTITWKALGGAQFITE